MTMPARLHPSQLSVVILLFLLNACGTDSDVNAAKQGVSRFHSEFNAKQFDSIYANASEEYRKAVTVEQNEKLFSRIQKKLGEAKDYSVTGWFVNFTPSGKIVRLQCKTRYAGGEADESFAW